MSRRRAGNLAGLCFAPSTFFMPLRCSPDLFVLVEEGQAWLSGGVCPFYFMFGSPLVSYFG